MTTSRAKRINQGLEETSNLTECLNVNFHDLYLSLYPRTNAQTKNELKAAQTLGIVKRMQFLGKTLLEQHGKGVVEELQISTSDTIRGWAAFAIGDLPRLKLKSRLQKVRPLADDHHFGVREWAWLAVRKHIVADPEEAIVALESWTRHPSPFVRRFASEATRPRGVWSEHITLLKQQPELGLPVLQPLMSDQDRYVQNSVGNWLNDAAKSQPKWVRSLCKRWEKESNTKATQYIIKRATRSL